MDKFGPTPQSLGAMQIAVIGQALFQTNPETGAAPKIGTYFPRHRTLVTTRPEVHAMQRQAFLEVLNQRREAAAQPPLSPEEEAQECRHSVSLFFQDRAILIRPALDCMELALEADADLQSLAPKHRIRFLHAQDPSVRVALRRRGELWRISQPPSTIPEMEDYIRRHQVAIGGRAIYRMNPTTGTRWLTYAQLAALGQLDDAGLAAHLAELARFSGLYNRAGQPELCFVPKCEQRPSLLARTDLLTLPGAEVRRLHAELLQLLEDKVPPDLRRDDIHNAIWRNALFKAMTEVPESDAIGEVVDGLGEAFYRQVLWLPGARFERGELVFDPLFQQALAPEADEAVRKLCDPAVKEFILNFLREFGEIEFVNVGRVVSPPAARPSGRRGVYVAEVRPANAPACELRILRMHRWGIREHLDDGDSLEMAMLKAHEYIHYVLDRRLACHQLGVNVPLRVAKWDIPEEYRRPDGRVLKIWASYYERDYIPGTALNRLGEHKLAQPEYARRLARLLGRAAATNLIVGRAEERTTEVIFDEGDELVIEDAAGLPKEIVICDHSRSFGNYLSPLTQLASAYGRPVKARAHLVPDPRAFAETYATALAERLAEMQAAYQANPNAFRALFQHLPVDPAGSFGFRWLQVLERLDRCDPAAVAAAVRPGTGLFY